MSSTDSASKILDVAERLMREVGYNAVSYRDIAAELGFKSASLHYHFPKKQDMGAALVRRYSDNFHARLVASTPETASPQEMITAFVDIYRFALEEQGLICLCAVLGAESAGLPHPVTTEIKRFFTENISWLTARYKALGFETPGEDARTTLALLEGVMIISLVNDDISLFDTAAKCVQDKIMTVTVLKRSGSSSPDYRRLKHPRV